MTIVVTNNPDGTYTVECGGESTIVGTPRSGIIFPQVSPTGGGFSSYIIDLPGGAPRGKRVSGVDELIANLSDLPRGALLASNKDRPLEYSLYGRHKIEIGKIHSVLDARTEGLPVELRVFLGVPRE